jgi:hypothetical protein
MKILITGATGLVGSSIVEKALNEKIEVNFLTTNKNKITTSKTLNGFYWNLKDKFIDPKCFKGVDTIIHLAGASISKKWTPKNKSEILDSRIDSTNLLKKGINEFAGDTIKTFVAASAVGIYPNNFEVSYGEETEIAPPKNFLQQVVVKWEAALNELSYSVKSFSIFRIGLVLSKKGGVLPTLVLPVKLFVGAAFGTGNQWQSWIHIDDLSQMLLDAAKQDWQGTYNAVAPNPVIQNELIVSLGQALSRPVFFPNLPSLLVKLVFGERSSLVLNSQKVSADKVLAKGFVFQYDNLKLALKALYHKKG